MKKAFILSLFLGMSAVGHAQIQKGSIMVTGTVNFNSGNYELTENATSTTMEEYSNITVGASGGYFVTDKIVVGLNLGYTSLRSDYPDFDFEERLSVIEYGAYGRYYIPVTNQFQLFGQADLNFGTGTLTSIDPGGTETEDYQMTRAGLGVGTTFFLSDRFYLDATMGFLGFTNTSITEDPDTPDPTVISNSEFGLNLDFTNVSIGAGFLF